MDLNYNSFCNKLQDPTITNRINKWKHNEKRTIIVTFIFPENNEYCLSIENRMQGLFKQSFANDVKLIFHTQQYEPFDKFFETLV